MTNNNRTNLLSILLKMCNNTSLDRLTEAYKGLMRPNASILHLIIYITLFSFETLKAHFPGCRAVTPRGLDCPGCRLCWQ